MTAGTSFVGNFGKGWLHNIAASLSFSGAYKKLTGKSAPASLTFTGGMAKFVSAPFTGALNFVGNLLFSHLRYQVFTASLSFSGSLIQPIVVFFTAGLSFAGNIGRSIGKGIVANLIFSNPDVSGSYGFGRSGFAESGYGQGNLNSSNYTVGQLVVTYLKSKGLYFTGALTFVLNKRMSSNLSFISHLPLVYPRTLVSNLSFSTSFLNPLVFFYNGVINFITSFFTKHISAPPNTPSNGTVSGKNPLIGLL